MEKGNKRLRSHRTLLSEELARIACHYVGQSALCSGAGGFIRVGLVRPGEEQGPIERVIPLNGRPTLPALELELQNTDGEAKATLELHADGSWKLRLLGSDGLELASK